MMNEQIKEKLIDLHKLWLLENVNCGNEFYELAKIRYKKKEFLEDIRQEFLTTSEEIDEQIQMTPEERMDFVKENTENLLNNHITISTHRHIYPAFCGLLQGFIKTSKGKANLQKELLYCFELFNNHAEKMIKEFDKKGDD